ncbi:oxygenase MpaB family protein [Rhodococcus sp. CH91]|uniref:oxygenase MpaB family protein n=1 Tax=Rhodococcus sp. CH91 TaxID=2910256 RepID=UPI001F4AF850|nr:oxygenase MpaB family protein [Rhodococcus sp. CH91]
MTTTTPRPAQNAPREDDGYFGPGSVSWKVYADPSSRVAGMAGLLLQALNPGMMRLFEHASAAYADPKGRDERTGRYLDTVMFGDKAHADAAAASVRRMHAHAVWDDPHTGTTLRADEPAWLDWTHNALAFALLRGAEAFGLDLTPAEQDAFVVEQHIAAELVGADPARLPATRADLEAYVDEQRHWLSLSLAAAEVTQALRKPSLRGNPVKVFTFVVVQDGMLSILPEWARLMYGIEGRPMNLRAAARTTKRLIGIARKSESYDKMVAEITTRIDETPYRKVRARKA